MYTDVEGKYPTDVQVVQQVALTRPWHKQRLSYQGTLPCLPYIQLHLLLIKVALRDCSTRLVSGGGHGKDSYTRSSTFAL
jgi:hypothetical protein